MLERVTLQKVSGVCAILIVVVAIVGFALFASTDVTDDQDAVEFLPAIDDDKAIIATSTWLFILAPILLLGTVPGIFQALRGAGDLLWFAVLASVIGGLLLISSTVTELAIIYEVATPYVKAGPDAGADLGCARRLPGRWAPTPTASTATSPTIRSRPTFRA